jgi:tetratricopeptide (TPR) repeat protein
VQGAAAARPWVEKAGATYRGLLDQQNQIGKAYNLKYVPIGIALDEQGRFDDDAFRAELVAWATSGAIPASWQNMSGGGRPQPLTLAEREADARFQLAIVLLERDAKAEAIAELKKAVRLDPQNWLIRKQLWALEAPQAFYSGAVDYDWQKAQMEREAAGLLAD